MGELWSGSRDSFAMFSLNSHEGETNEHQGVAGRGAPEGKAAAPRAATLSDAELLAIFLRTGVSGLSAVDLSRQLLQQFGSCGHCWGRAAGFLWRSRAGTCQACPVAGGAGDGAAPSGRTVATGRGAHLARAYPGLSASPVAGSGRGGVRPAAARQPAQGHPVCRTFTAPSTRRASGPEKSCRSRSNIMQPP